MPRQRTALTTAIATATAALLLSGCAGPGASGATPDDATSVAEGGFPVTIEHVYGETTIEAEPERVATVAWANHEVPLALGSSPWG